MTPAEEDALVKEIYDQTQALYPGGHNIFQAIRLAIRAAVAAERERCAKVCIALHEYDLPDGWEDSGIGCAAAIREGEK